MSDLSRRQAAFAGLGVFAAAIVPAKAAIYPEDVLATDLGKVPEPQWSIATGFDMAAECENVRLAAERCAKANEACARCRNAFEALYPADEATWEAENERLTAEWSAEYAELETAGRHFSDVKMGFTYRLLNAHGIADVFQF